MVSKSHIEFCLEGTDRITNISEWRSLVTSQWPELIRFVKDMTFKHTFHQFLALILVPMNPTNRKQAELLAEFLDKNGLVGSKRLRLYARRKNIETLNVQNLVTDIFDDQIFARNTLDLRSVLFSKTILASAKPEELFDIVVMLCKSANADMNLKISHITSENDVIIANGNVIKNTYNKSHNDALSLYLDNLRFRWNNVDFGNIVSDPMHQFHTKLHRLYIRLDVWSVSPNDKDHENKLATLQQKAILNDFDNERKSIVKSINDSKLHVIVGGPGTGKSTACGSIATGLAYACDPEAQSQDGIDGLQLLGEDWTHGPMLPVYVRLRHFASTDTFPVNLQQATSERLVEYIKQQHPQFADYFVRHFEKRVKGINGALLILDGLDEIFDIKQRKRAKFIIEHFAKKFPKCRILVTCRSAVYRPNHKWYLSTEFSVAEIAPYTRDQISQYVCKWYNVAIENRANSLGGAEFAAKNAAKLSESLSKTLLENNNLLSLARQPLLLTLLVVIHEENQSLPDNRAKLYENTVNLLNKWNPPNEEDSLATKLRNLDFDVVRESLQKIAFDFQRDDEHYKDNRPTIKQEDLVKELLAIKEIDKELGAAIDDVLEYLATRNGILVVDQNASYRFLHLSIREYLAACALIEQYNELKMPKKLKPSQKDKDWTFPDNICQLLNVDPYRWREVALFCGAILGNDKGQDRLWIMIEMLLPDVNTDLKKPLDEKDLYRIEIAGTIWSTNNMRTRLGSHKVVVKYLHNALNAIIDDKRFDVPERVEIQKILRRINSHS